MNETSILHYYVIPSLVLFNLAQIPFYKNVQYLKDGIYLSNNKRALKFIKFCILFVCIFGAFAGDWIHYQNEIEELGSMSQIPEQRHLEPLYIWIIQNITHSNYLFFRILVWSISLLCLDLGFKRLKLDNVTTWCCFMTLTLPISYSVGRGAFGFSLIVFGYSCLLNPGKQKLLGYVEGCILLALSIYCHKSMFLLIPLIFLSFIKLNIKRIIVILIAIALAIGSLRNYILNLLFADPSMAGQEYFVENEDRINGIGMNIWIYSYTFIIYAILAFAFIRLFIQHHHAPKYIRRILHFTILILFEYIAIHFAFTYVGLGSWDLSWRIFQMLNIPVPILFSYFLSRKCPKYMLYLYSYNYTMANYFIFYNIYTNY